MPILSSRGRASISCVSGLNVAQSRLSISAPVSLSVILSLRSLVSPSSRSWNVLAGIIILQLLTIINLKLDAISIGSNSITIYNNRSSWVFINKTWTLGLNYDIRSSWVVKEIKKTWWGMMRCCWNWRIRGMCHEFQNGATRLRHFQQQWEIINWRFFKLNNELCCIFFH